MDKRLTDRQAQAILIAGIGFLALGTTLGLYSVPSDVPGLPSFPFFSSPFPVLSLLVVLGSGSIAIGLIFHSRGSLIHVLAGSAVVVAAGLIWAAISFLTAIPFDLGGMIVYVEPYGAHAALVVAAGVLLALLGLVFWALDHFEKRREEKRKGERQRSS